MSCIFASRCPAYEVHMGDTDYAWGTSFAAGRDVAGGAYGDFAVCARPELQPGVPYYPPCLVAVYRGGPQIDTVPYRCILADDTLNNGQFGTQLQFADVNADGYSDLLVGSPCWNANAGAIFIYRGGPNGLDTTPGYVVLGHDGEPGHYRRSVGGFDIARGDLRGGGREDWMTNVLVGAPRYYRIEVYYSKPDFDTVPDYCIYNPSNAPTGFGAVIRSGGDVTGDGYDDILVGESGRNRILLYRGGPTPDTTPFWILNGDAESPLGNSDCAINVDLTGDGIDDIVVARADTSPFGRVEVYAGGETVAHTPAFTFHSPDSNDFGNSVVGLRLGAMNSSALAIGAPEAGPAVHGVYLFNKLYPWPTGYALADSGEVPFFGWLVHSAGDVDGDGCDEAIASDYQDGGGTLVRILKCTSLGVAERATAPPRQSGLMIRQVAPAGNAGAEFEVSGVKGGKLDVQVFDLTGRRAGISVVERTGSGQARITWSGQACGRARLSDGIYWVRASQAGSAAVCKFAMAR